MDSMFKWFIGFFFFLILALIIVDILPSQEARQRANGYKLDTCIKFANAIGVNPNDEKRSEFIKACFEKDELTK